MDPEAEVVLKWRLPAGRRASAAFRDYMQQALVSLVGDSVADTASEDPVQASLSQPIAGSSNVWELRIRGRKFQSLARLLDIKKAPESGLARISGPSVPLKSKVDGREVDLGDATMIEDPQLYRIWLFGKQSGTGQSNNSAAQASSSPDQTGPSSN